MSRRVETRAVAALLASASVRPSALVMEGEAGIGKTTLWLAATEQARELGFQVLSSRPAASRVVAGVRFSPICSTGSTSPSGRHCLTRSAWRWTDPVAGRAPTSATDQRAVAAGFLSVVEVLAARGPVVLAFDDLQWLDVSTQHVVAFAARRLTGPVGMLATVRTEADAHTGLLAAAAPS